MRSYAACVLGLVACSDGNADRALPEDPPVVDCTGAQSLPITSVHEHITDLSFLGILKAHLSSIDVSRLVLLPFLSNHREQNPLQLAESLLDDSVLSFVSVDTLAPDAAARARAHIAGGGVGVKLYAGNGDLHTPASMIGPFAREVYALAEELDVPILMHTNGPLFEPELRQVLGDYPDVRFLCPHYCLFASQIHRLHGLLEDYPNLYSDISFGAFRIALVGAADVSAHAPDIRAVVRHHATRFLFGTDLPLGKSEEKQRTADALVRAYRDMLEKEEYKFLGTDYKGLALDACTLEQLYRTNAERFLAR